MRGLIELKFLWLGLATVAAYTAGWVGLGIVSIELLLLVCAAMPLQKVTLVGIALLLAFALALGTLDAVWGGGDARQTACWFTVGACYLVLYEYIALYEFSAALSDYGVPSLVVGILNFGIRFIPIAFEGTREAFAGARARGGFSLGSSSTLGAIATAVFVRLLHKFEDMWISYNIRQTRTKRFRIKLDRADYSYMLLSLILISVIIWSHQT